jgi:iron complex transport system permease protein
VGDFPVPLGDVVAALAGAGGADASLVVLDLRLPRVACGLVVGAAFGVSGAVFQAVARNPLASPDIIGITAGASAAAVLLIVVVGASASALALGALAGGLGTAVAIYALAWKRGLSPYRLVLVGIGLSAVLAAVTSYLLTRGQITDVQRATVWLTGSLNGRGWEQAAPAGLALALLLPAVLALAPALRALQLGDDTAAAVGVPVQRARAALVVCAVALAAIATAAAGPVAFVAFVAAPIARRLVRTSLTLVPAALCGALLVVLADLVARRAFAPTELPVGVLTGLVGAPYLLWLLARTGRVGSAG